MNTSTEAIQGQISSQKTSTKVNKITKEAKVGRKSALIQVFIARAYGQIKEMIISSLYLTGVLAVYKISGLHSMWTGWVERLLLLVNSGFAMQTFREGRKMFSINP